MLYGIWRLSDRFIILAPLLRGIFVNKLYYEFLTKIFLCTKILPSSFRNDSHISYQTEEHKNLFWNENTFKISFQN